MGLFHSQRPKGLQAPFELENPNRVTQIDFSKRYDIYCTDYHIDRLYENVRIVGIRSLHPVTEFTSIGSFLEMEALDGSRWLLPEFGIRLICEHGTQPVSKVLRHRRSPRD